MPYLRVGPHVMSWCSAEPRPCREDPGPRPLLGSQKGRLRLVSRLCPAMSPPQDASSEGGGSVGPREWVQPRTHSLAQGVVPTSFLLLPPAPGGPAHILPGSYLPNQTSKPSKEPCRSPTQLCFAPSFGDKPFAEKARLLNPQKAPLIQPRHELKRE